MTALYYAHSGLRYLVLLAGVVALLVSAAGLMGRRPYGTGARIAGASFTGLLHLQILAGLALVLSGVWYPALAGHLILMILAAVVATVAVARARRAPEPRRAYGLAFGGTLLALLLIIFGIRAIGRGPLESRAPSLSAAMSPPPPAG